jgi:hypothetical protein
LEGNGFTTTVVIPPNVPPGTYMVSAVLSGQTITQSPITVVAANAVLAPILQIINSATGIAYSGPGFVAGNFPVPMQGFNFHAGPVDIFIDVTTGTKLASATANSEGIFKAAPIWPTSVTGDHSIVAQQGIEQATAAVFTPPAVQ